LCRRRLKPLLKVAARATLTTWNSKPRTRAVRRRTLAAVTTICIPATNNVAVDAVADLPGPGAIGLSGDEEVDF
jgi:hypothetical protein